MNLYQQLAEAKAYLRTCKDQYETTRAVIEGMTITTGKNAEDRKRELISVLAGDTRHTIALAQLRQAEYDVDQAQAAIDQAEAERRDREWSIRAKLAEALSGQREDAAFEIVTDRRAAYTAQRQMDELYK